MINPYFDKIEAAYDQLLNHNIVLTNSFIINHVANPLAGPDDFDLDVKAYCVLSHASLEEFVEEVAKITMQYSVETFVNSKNVSLSLLALIHFKSESSTKIFDEGGERIESIIKIKDYLREVCDHVKNTFSNELFNNHGVSLKYLKKILLPVAIDIPTDPNLLNSLSKITQERGSYAHKYTDRGVVRKSISPEVAADFVIDCLVFCEEIKRKAQAL